MKKVIKLTESDLKRIVKRVIKEEEWSPMVNIEDLKFSVFVDDTNITKNVKTVGVIVEIDVKTGTFEGNETILVSIGGGLTFDESSVSPKPNKILTTGNMTTLSYDAKELLSRLKVNDRNFIENGAMITLDDVNLNPIEDRGDTIKEPDTMRLLLQFQGSKMKSSGSKNDDSKNDDPRRFLPPEHRNLV